jgi:histidinol-phosphate/aromatic aminotransferase/cobyric acid decarboxylase-like protein
VAQGFGGLLLRRNLARDGDQALLARNFDELRRNQADALLISPERLANDRFVEELLLPVANRIGLMVVDEAYGQFATATALDLVDDDAPVVVSRTFSKTWSLAALRLAG